MSHLSSRVWSVCPLLIVLAGGCTRSLDGDKFRHPLVDDAGAGAADPGAGATGDAGPDARCGDGVCGGGESVCTCAEDCGQPSCGDAICCPDLEDQGSCGEDCAGGCGDGLCLETENACSCPADCGQPTCGDGVCCAGAGEDRCSCPADCVRRRSAIFSARFIGRAPAAPSS